MWFFLIFRFKRIHVACQRTYKIIEWNRPRWQMKRSHETHNIRMVDKVYKWHTTVWQIHTKVKYIHTKTIFLVVPFSISLIFILNTYATIAISYSYRFFKRSLLHIHVHRLNTVYLYMYMWAAKTKLKLWDIVKYGIQLHSKSWFMSIKGALTLCHLNFIHFI